MMYECFQLQRFHIAISIVKLENSSIRNESFRNDSSRNNFSVNTSEFLFLLDNNLIHKINLFNVYNYYKIIILFFSPPVIKKKFISAGSIG
jgi:hypothetical protein